MLSRLIKSIMPSNINNVENDALIHEVIGIHLRALIMIPAAFLLLFLLTYQYGFSPAHKVGDWSPNSFELIFICVSIVFEFLAIFWFRLSGWQRRNNKTAIDLWSRECSRLILIVISPILGCVLRITGSGWHIVSTLFILSIIVLALSFPTKNRITKWGINQNTSSQC